MPGGFDVGGFFVAGVEDEAVVELEGLVGFDGVSAVRFFGVKGLGTEGIGGEQAVGAGVPVGGEAEAGGVIEHGDAEVLAVNGAMEIAPASAFGPGVAVLMAFAVDHFAAEFGVNGHAGGNADAEAGVFAVIGDDGAG